MRLRAADRRDAAPEVRATRAGAALLWSLANTAVARIGTLAIGVVLARLLGPEEFGTYAVAFVALMAVLSFNELGVSLAIVRWEEDPARIAPTVTTISVAMSAVLTALAVALGPAFAAAMGDSDAALPVQLLALCVLINGAVATPAALLQRTFRQDQRMVADQVNVWVGALVSVAFAWSGAGAMSLVIGRLAGAGLSACLFLRYSPLPYRLGLDRQYARQLLAFGLPLAGASVVVFLVGFVDQLVVGHTLGALLLGYYVLAFNLASWPVTLFSQPLRMVAPALFARMQDDPARLRRSFGQVLRPLTAVALPVCAGIAVVAPQLVELVYGTDWLPAAVVLRWLAVLAAFRILFELSYDYLVVLRRSRSILRIQVVGVVVLVPAVWAGVRVAEIEGAALTLVLVAAAVTLPLYLVEFHRCGVRVGEVVSALRMPLVGATTVAVLSGALVSLLGGGFACLVVCGLITAATAATCVWRTRADLTVLRTEAAS